jgi:hypothetical protein
MDSANNIGNSIGLRVVSPDRPTKSAVAIGTENPVAARCGPKNESTRSAVMGESPEHYQHRLQDQPVHPTITTRRNSSIGMSLLFGEETNDTISTFQQQQQLGYPSYSTMQPGPPMMERRDNYLGAPRDCDESNAGGRIIAQYRPLVGSGAAAAYEALRHDFYVQKNIHHHSQAQRRMSSLSFGSAKEGLGGIGGVPGDEQLDEVLRDVDPRSAQGDE